MTGLRPDRVLPRACGQEVSSGELRSIVGPFHANPPRRGGLGHERRRETVSTRAGEHGDCGLLVGPDRVRDKVPSVRCTGSGDDHHVAVVGRHRDEGVTAKASGARAVAGMMVA